MISLDVTVFAIRLNSCFVDSVSAVTILVPSDRTTRSKGMIRSANGRLRSKIRTSTCHNIWEHPRETLDDHKCNISIRRNSSVGTFLVILRKAVRKYLLVHLMEISCFKDNATAYLIAPPTNCPRFRETIHNAKYFPRAPDGARVMMAPASATYQHAVPIPLIAPLRIKY